jgi:hypothetical protein
MCDVLKISASYKIIGFIKLKSIFFGLQTIDINK